MLCNVIGRKCVYNFFCKKQVSENNEKISALDVEIAGFENYSNNDNSK